MSRLALFLAQSLESDHINHHTTHGTNVEALLNYVRILEHFSLV